MGTINLRTFWITLILFLLLTGCSQAAQTPGTSPPRATPLTINVGLHTVADPVEGALLTCAAALPELGLVITPVASQPRLADYDILIHPGTPAFATGISAQLAEDQLALIVHPDNALSRLTLEELSAIYSGQITSWSELTPPPDVPVQEIQVWTYPAGSFLREAGIDPLLASDRFRPPAHNLAPGPAAMREAIAGQSGALGLLPASWVDRTVKTVEIDGEIRFLSFPILASASETTPQVQALVACLQSGAGSQVLPESFP